jgi:hypothetical protein
VRREELMENEAGQIVEVGSRQIEGSAMENIAEPQNDIADSRVQIELVDAQCRMNVLGKLEPLRTRRYSIVRAEVVLCRKYRSV